MREQVERARGRTDLRRGDAQIAGRGFQTAMPEQQLNRAHVGAGFQEMDREGVAQLILTLPMNQAPPQPPFTTVTIRFTVNT